MLCRCSVWMIVLLVPAVMMSAPAEAQPTPPPAPPGQAPADHPIRQYLDRLFGRWTETSPGTAQTRPEAVVRDLLDERAVVNREHTSTLRQAERRLADGEPRDAARLLEPLLAVTEDSLVLSESGTWRSLHAQVHEWIGAEPALRAAFLEQCGASASELLGRAKTARSLSQLAEVTRRYFHTPAGYAAADQMGTHFLDAGERAEAAFWFGRLLDAAAPVTRDAQWQTKAALAGVRPGEPSGTTALPMLWTPSLRDPSAWPLGRPLLLTRWSHPLTGREAIAQQLRDLLDELKSTHQSPLLTAEPLAVGGRVVFPTLQGFSIVDADTGRLLWDLPTEPNAERLLAGESVPRPGDETAPGEGFSVTRYPVNVADQHPLGNLLFRDGVSLRATSDGTRLFVLEDHATMSQRPPGYFWGQRGPDDTYGRNWSCNRLSAYDLDSGRRNWSIGGPDEPSAMPTALAGTFFLSPPVAEGDALYVVGELRGVQTLHVLDRRTGQPRWSHALAAAPTSVEHDLVRRWWPAAPTVGPGVIICPTTVGWLVAIDRYEHRIRWAYRYTARRDEPSRTQADQLSTLVPFGERWEPSAPLLAGDAVLVTPAELPDPVFHDPPRLVCLDVRTGQPLWARNKDEALYVGGIIEFAEEWTAADSGATVAADSADGDDADPGPGRGPSSESGRGVPDSRWPHDPRGVLLVGRSELSLLGLQDGEVLATTAFPRDAGSPAGRGIVSGNTFWLPLTSGRLLSFQFAPIPTKTRLPGQPPLRELLITQTLEPADERPLGNLAVSQGRLLSLTPFGLTCYDSQDEFARQLAPLAGSPDARDTRPAEIQPALDGPADRTAMTLRVVERNLLDGEVLAALAELRSLGDPRQLSAEHRSEHRRLLWSTLKRLAGRAVGAEGTAPGGRRLSEAEPGARAIPPQESPSARRDARPPQPQDVLDEMRQLAASSAERWLVERLELEWLLARGDCRRAFEHCWRLAHLRESVTLDIDQRSVQVDRWLAGILGDIREQAGIEERDWILAQISAKVAALDGAPADDLDWWNRVLQQFPEAATLEVLLARHARDQHALAESEVRLLRAIDRLDLRDTPDAAPAAHPDPRAMLLDLMTAHGRVADAHFYRHGWSTVHEARRSWGDSTLEMTRSSGQYNRQLTPGSALFDRAVPSLDDVQLRLRTNLGRLVVDGLAAAQTRTGVARPEPAPDGVPLDSGKLASPMDSDTWETALGAHPLSYHGQSLQATSVGQLVLVVHRGNLHGISLSDRAVLWRRALSRHPSQVDFSRGMFTERPHELRDYSGFVGTQNLRRSRPRILQFPVVRAGLALVTDRDTVSLLDPLTGVVQWTRTGLDGREAFHVMGSLLLVISPTAVSPTAFRIVDGAEVPLPGLQTLGPETIAVTDRGVLKLELVPTPPGPLFPDPRRPSASSDPTGSGGQSSELPSGLGESSRRREYVLSVFDPVSGDRVSWVTFPLDTRFSTPTPNTLVAIEPSGTVRLVDWSADSDRILGQVPDVDQAAEVFAVAGRGVLFLAVNQTRRSGSRSEVAPSLPVDGKLLAFASDPRADADAGSTPGQEQSDVLSPSTSRLLWELDVEDQHLSLVDFEHLPVLLLVARSTDRRMRGRADLLRVELIDKFTGRRILQDRRYVSSNPLQSLQVDLPARTLDLRSYSDWLHMGPTQNGAAGTPAPTTR